jgi:uncharacterized protein YdeI (YjbR/CyaY-like superfamily)
VGGDRFQPVGVVEPWPDQRDSGRYAVTRRRADRFVFKVPSLRNVERTAPYFHDGQVAALDDAVRLMARHQLGRELDEGEVEAIVTGLKTLTGTVAQDYVAPPHLPASATRPSRAGRTPVWWPRAVRRSPWRRRSRARTVCRMAMKLRTLDVRTRAEWRRWLAQHHASSPGIWLIRHKLHSGVKSMSYEDVVSEALCFGWIDSLLKRVDDDRFAIKVTPRQPTSKWSDINRRRWQALESAGLLAAPGLAAAPTSNRYAPKPSIPELPAYIARVFKANAKAWRNFQALAPTYRRDFVVWIHTAKRPETRERRIRESIELLSAGKKLGLK